MRPIFHAELTNRTFGDPGVYVDLKFERRALLFDIGDISALPTRKLLRIRDVFVSHMHMDHFCGFDQLVAGLSSAGTLASTCTGRQDSLRSWSTNSLPTLGTWCRTTRSTSSSRRTSMTVTAGLQRARFRGRSRFAREALPDVAIREGVLLDDPLFRVRVVAAAAPRHHLARVCLRGEYAHERVEEPAGGIGIAYWAVAYRTEAAGARGCAGRHADPGFAGEPAAGVRDETMPLGQLKRDVLQFVPGQKVCYVTDVADTAGQPQCPGEIPARRGPAVHRGGVSRW